MSYLEKISCLRFKDITESPAESNSTYVYLTFVNSMDICAYVTLIGFVENGNSSLYLSPLCSKKEVALHELFHIAGFIHEFNRADRDENISNRKIRKIWGRIVPAENDPVYRLGLPFDKRKHSVIQ